MADAPPAAPNKHALTFVLVTVLIDMIGLGLIIPVVPGIIRELAGVDISGASTIGGWLFVVYSLLQFLFGPIVGNLSDSLGRRPVLLVAIFGLGVDYVFTAFAPTIAWLFVGRIVAGMCGASYTTANAYIADVTPPEGRGKAFGLVGGAFGVGFVLGPALGGLLGELGHRVPFFVAAGLSFANFVYGWFVVPESLSKDKRRPFSFLRANPVGAVASLWQRKNALGLASTLFLFFLANTVYPAVWTYYVMYRYGWSERAIGISLAAYGVITAVVEGGLVGVAIRRFGERRAVVLSLLVALVTCVGYAFATEGWMLYVWIVLGCSQGIAVPAVNAILSHQTPPEAQGELQGAVASLTSLSSIFGPILMTQLFGRFTGKGAVLELPGAPFLLAAALCASAIVVFASTTRRKTSEISAGT